MIARLFLLGVRHPLPVSAVLVLLTAFLAAGMGRLELDTSFDSLIPTDDPDRLIYQRVMGEFGSDNKTIVYVRDDELWSPDKLARLDGLRTKLAGIAGVLRVDSLFDLRVIQGENGRVTSRPVLERIPETLDQALIARERALENPLYLGNFFSDDGAVTAIVVSALDEEDRAGFSRDLYLAIDAALAEYTGDFDALFQVGPPRINQELRESLARDFMVLGPLSAFVLIAAILFFMRSGLAALAPLATSALSIVWTFGLLGWLGMPLTILSAMIPSLIIVIGSTEDTHIMAAFFRGLDASACAEEEDEDLPEDMRRAAVGYAGRHVGLPLLLTVLTTGLGFASNLASEIGLIRSFAIASTFAMVANGIVTLLVVPMLLDRFGPTQRPAVFERNEAAGLPARVIEVFRVPQDRFPMRTLAITALLCAFFIWEASTLHATNDPLSYFPEDRPLVQETRRINADLAGVKVFFVTLEADADRAFLEPRNLRRLEEVQDFLDRQGVFDTSVSLADQLRYVNTAFRGDFAEGALPESRELVAQYLLFFHRGDLDSYVSADYRRANIVVRHSIDDSHLLNRYVFELEEVLDEISGPGIDAMVIGENLMVNRAADSLMGAQIQGLALLLALIFVIMSAMFTSLKGGAIAMIPSVIPVAIMFGTMGLLEIPLNPGTAIVAVIAIGISVDGTIHLLARYNELCRRTSDYVGAVRQAVAEEATPLVVSSVALAFGFGILLFSAFTVVAQFGALAAATMLISIVANLLVTPIIMARIRLVGLYQILSMSVDREVLDTSPLFRGMTDYQRRKAILISELNEFEAGECLVQQGDVGRSMYLILDGEAEVVRVDGEERRRLAVLKPGQVFGEIGYIRAIERTANVQAATPVSALRFDYEKLQQDLKFFPNIVAKLNFNISGILGERVAELLDASSSAPAVGDAAVVDEDAAEPGGGAEPTPV
ncbi:MAG: MMPL family transporter [Pseudomonadales bacterium]|jgi:predicted RND superfamily exporter protein|nr:MMPL family transporter [Pseudomonadales bacterium]